jgi:hypothetical protein
VAYRELFRSTQRKKTRKNLWEGYIDKKALVGSKVNVMIDGRDAADARGLIGIAHDVTKGVGCRIATRHCILSGEKNVCCTFPVTST